MVDVVHRDQAVDRPDALERRAPGLAEAERSRRPRRQRPGRNRAQDDGGDGASPALDLVLEEAVRGLEQPGSEVRPGDDRPLPPPTADQTLLLQAGERLPNRRARQPEMPTELLLRGNREARRPAAADDLVLEELRELEVERDRRLPGDCVRRQG